MKLSSQKHGFRLFAVGSLFLYLVFHIATVDWFPLVHSDEVWLAALTRSMLHEGSLAATEDVFAVTERHPHALKSLFHLVQMPFVLVAYDHLAVRLVSVLSAVASVVLFFAAARRLLGNAVVAGALTVVLAVDIQFVYIAHLARQEALLVLVWCVVLGLVLRPRRGYHRPVIAARIGAVVGLAVGIHPNAFVLGMGLVGVFAADLAGAVLAPARAVTLRRRQATVAARNLGACVAAGVAAAAVFVGAGLLMDARFFENYSRFGAEVGLYATLPERVFGFLRHLRSVYFQIAGTYYLPPVRLQLWVLAVGPVVGVLFAWSSAVRRLVAAQVGMVLGIIAIGKYGPPATVLLWPAGLLIAGCAIDGVVCRVFAPVWRAWSLRPVARVARVRQQASGVRGSEPSLVPVARVVAVLVGVWAAGTAVHTAVEMHRWRDNGYREYLRTIERVIAADRSAGVAAGSVAEGRVLANLNAGFGFGYDKLRTWHDLEPLTAQNAGAFTGFIRDHDIEYIVYPDELDVIVRERPVWNAAYGNVYAYYAELSAILADAELVGEFISPCYAMRLVVYSCTSPYRVRIYRVPAVMRSIVPTSDITTTRSAMLSASLMW